VQYDLPLVFAYSMADQVIIIRCSATEAQNRDEKQCLWIWRLGTEDPETRWYVIRNAINHSLARHLPSDIKPPNPLP